MNGSERLFRPSWHQAAEWISAGAIAMSSSALVSSALIGFHGSHQSVPKALLDLGGALGFGLAIGAAARYAQRKKTARKVLTSFAGWSAVAGAGVHALLTSSSGDVDTLLAVMLFGAFVGVLFSMPAMPVLFAAARRRAIGGIDLGDRAAMAAGAYALTSTLSAFVWSQERGWPGPFWLAVYAAFTSGALLLSGIGALRQRARWRLYAAVAAGRVPGFRVQSSADHAAPPVVPLFCPGANGELDLGQLLVEVPAPGAPYRDGAAPHPLAIPPRSHVGVRRDASASIVIHLALGVSTLMLGLILLLLSAVLIGG